jgi:ATP-dependent helicase HrpA
MLARGREHLPFAIQDIAKLIAPLWENYHQVCVALEEIASGEKWSAARKDLKQQLAGLTSDGFLISTPWNWLQHFPRYFQGMQQRIEKLTDSGHARDTQTMAELRPLISEFGERQQIHSDRSVFDPELVEYRWMLEEYRVSLFCQTLGTAIKISPQRLEKQWAKVSY